jgi:Ca2+-binding RTX toxin-like protein
VVALGGSDTIMAQVAAPVAVVGGSGDDTIFGGSAQSTLWGGDGNDTIFGNGGRTRIYGANGSDTIFAGNGENCVEPGPAADTVNLGTGADTVRINHICEVASGEQIIAGPGNDTLITPVPISELTAAGAYVEGFENVVIANRACESSCSVKPGCSGHGHCVNETQPGVMSCACDPGHTGPACDQISTSTEIDASSALAEIVASRTYTAPAQFRDGEWVYPEAKLVRVPEELEVSRGNAGNGIATLTIFDESNRALTCTYRGGASVSHPTQHLDIVKGRRYLLTQCVAQPGGWGCFEEELQVQGLYRAKKVTLHVDTGDALWPGDLTEIGVRPTSGDTDGDGNDEECGELKPFASAYDVAEFADTFSWAVTTPLAESDANGDPVLWYTEILIQSPEEVAALDALHIHYDQLPLFAGELDALHGKCGVMQNDGGGNGVIVYALITGQTFNKLREWALNPDPSEPDPTKADRTIFRAVRRRALPLAAQNPDGSVSTDALVASKFYYRDVQTLAPVPPGGRGWIADLAKKLFGEIQDGVRWITDKLGQADRYFNGSVKFHIDLNVGNTDSIFDFDGNAMVQAWGAKHGDEISAPGLFTIRSFWGVAPATFHGVLSQGDGADDIFISKDANLRTEAYCLRYESDDVVLSKNGLLPAFFCDFRIEDWDTSQPRDIEVEMKNRESNVYVQAHDSLQYLDRVAGFRRTNPRRAQILMGPLATTLSFFGDRAWAPCFGFPHSFSSNVADFLSARIIGTHGAGVAATRKALLDVAFSQDIFFPWGGHASSRGVPTHELGHFALCAMIDEHAQRGHIPEEITQDVMAEMVEDQIVGDPGPSDEANVMNEAFADLFAAQVVGGVNYFEPLNSSEPDNDNRLQYCVPGADPSVASCLENNWVAPDLSPYVEAIGEYVVFVHDAFDGHYEDVTNSFRDVPGDGLAWDRYIVDFGLYNFPKNDSRDEYVAADGKLLYNWVGYWLATSRELNRTSFTNGFARALEAEANWCERCSLFCTHDGICPAMDTIRDQWQWCATESLVGIRGIPDEHFRINAATCRNCPDDTISNDSGACESCGPGEAASGNVCEPCEPISNVPFELDEIEKDKCYEKLVDAAVVGGALGCGKRASLQFADIDHVGVPTTVTAVAILPEPENPPAGVEEDIWYYACRATSIRLVVVNERIESGAPVSDVVFDEEVVGIPSANGCRLFAQYTLPPDSGFADFSLISVYADVKTKTLGLPTDEVDDPETPMGCDGTEDPNNNCCGNSKPCHDFQKKPIAENNAKIRPSAEAMIHGDIDVRVLGRSGVCPPGPID